MEREDTPIELGTASVDTKGPYAPTGDLVIGAPLPSLADD